MSAGSFLAERLDASTWPLAVGDVIAILVFLTAGAVVGHAYEPEFFLAEPLFWAGMVAPFLIGWLLAAPLVGAYSPGAGSAPNSSIPLAIRSWIPAAVVALVLRWSPVFRGGFDVAFAVVMLVGGAVVLAAWRFLYFTVR